MKIVFVLLIFCTSNAYAGINLAPKDAYKEISTRIDPAMLSQKEYASLRRGIIYGFVHHYDQEKIDLFKKIYRLKKSKFHKLLSLEKRSSQQEELMTRYSIQAMRIREILEIMLNPAITQEDVKAVKDAAMVGAGIRATVQIIK